MTMPPAPVEVAQSIYDAFRVRDAAKTLSLFSPRIELTQSEELPWGGVYHGHEGALAFFSKLTSRIDSTAQLDRLNAAGSQVAAVGWTTGRTVASGTPYRVPIVHLWTIEDGLAIRVHFLIDNAAMLSALAGDLGPTA